MVYDGRMNVLLAGGVPGCSTSSVALNSLYAPNTDGGINMAASLQVVLP
jgi:hypothetical protein